mgnify:CR=1 FL=1
MHDNDDPPLNSRSGTSNPFGKCTEEVKARIPYEIKEGFARIAHELGMNESELLRELVMLRVIGVDGVRRLNDERLALVAGNGHK